MYKALVHSVPGSGTRFVCEFAEKCLDYKRSHSEIDLVEYADDNTYCHTHVWQALDPVVKDERVRVIFPLRSPYLSYLTRRYRVGKTSDTVEQKRQAVILHWKTLIKKAKYMNPLYVPVEAGLDNRKLLQSIVKHLDAPVVNQEKFEEFVTRWPKVGTAGARYDRDVYEATGFIDGRQPTFLDFAVDWYEAVVQSINT